MRASVQEQTGTAGANEVAADFERIGWGTAKNSEHDLGTDLFLMARDHRLFDLGLVVGAQVKAGPTWFKEAQKASDGSILGWWFRESDRKHFDWWLSHRLPHLIVLHDLNSRISYWAPITEETVESTGKGAKVFVPAENIVNADNFDRLLAFATDGIPTANWEGTAWLGKSVSPATQLRHAMLTPRLVAPHPNRGMESAPTAAQVIALLTQVRLQEIERSEEAYRLPPSFEEMDPNTEWEWQLAAAFKNFLAAANPDVFLPLQNSDRETHEQAAATVMYAAALLENGRPEEAISALDELLERDAIEVVDDAWVRLQRARALSECGRRQEARDEALKLVDVGRRVPGDATAAAIGGAAANTVLAVADWDERDFGTNMAASDTTASWWRAQTSSWGLSEQAKRSFEAWGRDTAQIRIGADQAWTYLRSASLLAGLLGDHSAWRHTIRDLATYALSDYEYGTDLESITAALTDLRRSGDHKAVKLATRRLVSGGPYSPVRSVAMEIIPAQATLTSVQADLQFLVDAGDLLPESKASAVSEWAQRTFLDPDPFTARTRPRFLLRPILIDIMTATADAIDDDGLQKLADFVLELPVQADQVVANRLANLVRIFPARIWTAGRAQRAAERANSDHWELKYPLLSAASTHIRAIRQQLEEEAKEGSLWALGALGNVRKIDAPLVDSLIQSITILIEAQIQDATRGKFGLGGPDLGRTATLLSIWHPVQANWEIVLKLLTSPHSDDQIFGTLELLARLIHEIPDDIERQLLPIIEAISVGNSLQIPSFREARPIAARLVTELLRRAGQTAVEEVAALARGNVAERCQAAVLAREQNDSVGFGVLITLLGDPEPRVRAATAETLAIRAADGEQSARALLPTLVTDSGVLVARTIATASMYRPELAAFTETQALQHHHSGAVRRAFAEGRQARSESSE